MLRRFWNDENGNFAMMTAVAMVPLLGALALGVDYSEMTRQRQLTQNALDAAGIATARRVTEGATGDEAKAYAKDFFQANLGSVNPADTTLDVVLPADNTGGGTLKMSASLAYKPYFFGAFKALVDRTAGSTTVPFTAMTEIRLKNTLEVALVLDNSGSMDYTGTNSSKKRIELLRDAAKQLVDTMAGQAKLMKQVSDPVQFALVPFAASVNVGSGNKSEAWMDATGISPVHNENLDWPSAADNGSDRRVEKSGNAYWARGNGWGDLKDKPLTRFTVFDNITRVMTRSSNGTETYAAATSWSGCVEARPYPLNIDDTAPSANTPATLFVPMYAPDEFDAVRYQNRDYVAGNNWWKDATSDNGQSLDQAKYKARQTNMLKFLTAAPLDSNNRPKTFMGDDMGPNSSCTTKPITPLKDVSTKEGADAIKAAIDKMTPDGTTNVPEGLAWGWRAVSSAVPFTKGRPEAEKGNDKVVIVLTDGENTYYTPGDSGRSDLAGNKSTYAAYGYTGTPYDNGDTRMFRDPANTYSKTDHSASNFTKAMNAQFASLCANPAFIKLKTDSSGKQVREGQVTVITIALDLDSRKTVEKAQIAALKACASPSRITKDKVLFWNATGATLDVVFEEIADELSNLRIVG